MVNIFSCFIQHSNVVNSLYRTLLRNSINLRKLNHTDNTKLIRKIRSRFRKNSLSTNSILAQTQLKEAMFFNNLIVDSFDDDNKLKDLISRLNPIKSEDKLYTESITKEPTKISEPFNNSEIIQTSETIQTSEPVQSSEPVISKKIRKNPNYKDLTDNEILEFRQTKDIELPESTKYLLTNMNVHLKWIFDIKHYPSIKGKLDKRYMRTIFPSLVAYEKQKYYLNKLDNKLKNPPTHKLKRISGTGHWIYLINTPWNRDLKTENFKFLGECRRKYDDLIIKIQECENYRIKNEFMFLEEGKWENLINNSNNSTKEWTQIFDEADAFYQNEKRKLEFQIREFCKRQGIIYEKIKPVFDEMHNHSKFNLNVMKLDLKNLQNGPFTDIVDGGLGSVFKKYGFHDPVETKYLKKNMSSTKRK